MVRKGVIFLTLVLLIFFLSVEVRAFENPHLIGALTNLLRQNPVVILGETHQQPESPRLVADVVEAYLGTGGCLTVALEIASDQQADLDAGVQGIGPVSDVVLHPIIDHPPYRDMLGRFRDLRQVGKCLKVHAIDSPREEPGPKDEWMAREVHKLVSSGPVLVVVGNLHALKRIQWESGKDDPYLAERLARQGLPVVSVLQEWETACEERKSSLLGVRHPHAAAALRSIMSPVAAHPYETPEEAADYVTVWECIETER